MNAVRHGLLWQALAVSWIGLGAQQLSADESRGQASWSIGKPIVTYWAGPPMSDSTAQQMADGGWNLVWCRETACGPCCSLPNCSRLPH
jgi:hypothetical protein